MNSVNMKRDELIRIVKENRIKHIADFQEAEKDYAVAVVTVAKFNLKVAQSDAKVKKFKSYPTSPRSYETDYTRAERMLTLSVDEVIEVDEHIFNQLVLDEWSWKQQFNVTNTSYKTV